MKSEYALESFYTSQVDEAPDLAEIYGRGLKDWVMVRRFSLRDFNREV